MSTITRPPRIIWLVVFLVGLAALGVYLVSHFDTSSGKSFPQFPEKLETRIELRESEDAIQYRFIKVSSDGERLIQIRSEFRDGSTVYDYFRDDGTLREETEYFPSESVELSTRQLRRVSDFDETGKKIVSSKQFREDGSADIFTRLRADGSLETEQYSEDGQYLAVRQVVDKFGLLTVREEYGSAGKLARVVREKDKYETHIITYGADGFTRHSMTVRKRSRSSGYGYSYYDDRGEYILYHDDGVTVAMKVDYPWSSKTRVSYFGPNGNLIEKREYSEYGSFELTAYWPNGEKKFEQTWSGPGNRVERTDISSFRIKETVEFNLDGEKTREVTYWDNGKAKKVRDYDGKNAYSGMTRKYREDGTLESEQEQFDTFDYGELKEVEADEAIQVQLPEEIYTVPEREKAPDSRDLPRYDRSEDI